MIAGPSIEEIVAAIRLAQKELRSAAIACEVIEAIAGPGIWAEGHPLDKMKLARLEAAQDDLAAKRSLLAEVLRDTDEGGHA